jgi:membrane-bound ClpP family serine protease
MPRISRQQEVARLRKEYDASFPRTMELLERHFAVLHNRSQVLLTLCGIVISTTGFSGRLIAGTNATAQALIVVGVVLILLSAVMVCYAVLHLRWLTIQAGDSFDTWLENSLRYRDLKTIAYRASLVVMLLGMTCYCGAIAIMLLHPYADALPAR